MIFLFVGIFLFFHTCIIWLWYRRTHNPSVVDVGWALGLTLSGLIYLYHEAWTLRSTILGAILLLWGIRLGGYLWFTRIRHKIVDKRYISLSENWKIAKPLGFFLNFLLQGSLIFIISIPWYFTAMQPDSYFSALDIAGMTLFIVAIILETAADRQLTQFKATYPGKVCDQKLWRYSRHPNYFFEWLIWCAFTLFALPAPYGWIAIISPLTLYFIMTRITAPMTEQLSVQSRGESYRNYQKKTPMFFPRWFFK